jgi:hypothetical protein
VLSKLQIAERILSLESFHGASDLVNEVWEHQYGNNAVLREFVQQLQQKDVSGAHPVYLPVELFKHHRVSYEPTEELLFKSSGTTGQMRSTHAVANARWYEQVSRTHFERCYGPLSEWVILALLPSYQENGDSSLVYMVDHFIQHAKEGSGFVLHEPSRLAALLAELRSLKQKTLLFGVSYALLDFAEAQSISFPELTIMETGGMKGRRAELTRSALHEGIRKGFPDATINSEYGMTELLSQAYAQDGEWFTPPPWFKAVTVDVSDPLHVLETGRRGLLAFIDLANLDSCAFIQTKDIGLVDDRGRFLVEGRMDNSDLRGCNLLYV